MSSPIVVRVNLAASAQRIVKAAPAGFPGNVWRNGSGVPSNSLGRNGDYYLDDATGNYYRRVSGAYALQGNLKGEDGEDGDASGVTIGLAAGLAIALG